MVPDKANILLVVRLKNHHKKSASVSFKVEMKISGFVFAFWLRFFGMYELIHRIHRGSFPGA